VPFGLRGRSVETVAVVLDGEPDPIVGLMQRDPDVPGLGVLERVRGCLAGDLVDEELDRRGKRNLDHVGADARGSTPAHVIREALDRFGQTPAADGRSMQVPDEGTDHVGGLLLGLEDTVQVPGDRIDLSQLEPFLGHLDLKGEAEELLGEIVVEVAGDLHPLVLSLLCHPVRKRPQNLFAVLELLPRLLQGEVPEEHLPGEDQRKYEGRDGE